MEKRFMFNLSSLFRKWFIKMIPTIFVQIISIPKLIIENRFLKTIPKLIIEKRFLKTITKRIIDNWFKLLM